MIWFWCGSTLGSQMRPEWRAKKGIPNAKLKEHQVPSPLGHQEQRIVQGLQRGCEKLAEGWNEAKRCPLWIWGPWRGSPCPAESILSGEEEEELIYCQVPYSRKTQCLLLRLWFCIWKFRLQANKGDQVNERNLTVHSSLPTHSNLPLAPSTHHL